MQTLSLSQCQAHVAQHLHSYSVPAPVCPSPLALMSPCLTPPPRPVSPDLTWRKGSSAGSLPYLAGSYCCVLSPQCPLVGKRQIGSNFFLCKKLIMHSSIMCICSSTEFPQEYCLVDWSEGVASQNRILSETLGTYSVAWPSCSLCLGWPDVLIFGSFLYGFLLLTPSQFFIFAV